LVQTALAPSDLQIEHCVHIAWTLANDDHYSDSLIDARFVEEDGSAKKLMPVPSDLWKSMSREASLVLIVLTRF
jgi:hypothetical protein